MWCVAADGWAESSLLQVTHGALEVVAPGVGGSGARPPAALDLSADKGGVGEASRFIDVPLIGETRPPPAAERSDDAAALPEPGATSAEGGAGAAAPPGTPVADAAARGGIEVNTDSSEKTFVSSFVLCVVVLAATPIGFAELRRRFPPIFSHNAVAGRVQRLPEDGILGWALAAWSATKEDIADTMGLDQAMYVEYLGVCAKILAVTSAAMLLIISPLSLACVTGEEAMAGAVRSERTWHGNPVLWAYAAGVWIVALAAQRIIFSSQRSFLKLRFKWLQKLPKVRANTVLVEGIPPEYRCDEKLFRFFEDMVTGDGNVERAYIVRDTSELAPVVARLAAARARLREARLLAERPRDAAVAAAAVGWWRCWAPRSGRIEDLEAEVAQLEAEARVLRERLHAAAREGPGSGALLSTGFVTFFQRVEAEVARRLEVISADSEEWLVSTPPCPSDVQWSDFTQDGRAEMSNTLIGYAFVVGLYFAYMPIVVGAIRLAQLVHLGPAQPLWESYAPTFCLQFMVACLPFFLLAIFRGFFILRAAAWAQHRLQQWYFWFLLVYVVLGIVVGQDVAGFFAVLLNQPVHVIVQLELVVPTCTNFFMNYCLVSLYTNCVILMRPFTLASFVLLRRIYEEEEARQLAEPEDQNSQGMGARSAQASIILTIGLIYGSVNPLVCVFACASFVVARLVYGYLVLFAETKKADLGGAFWVTKINHTFIALLLYASLVTAFIARRDGLGGPAVVAASSIAFLALAWHRFETGFRWEKLPMQDLLQDTGAAYEPTLIFKGYCQPELEEQEAYSTHSAGRRRVSDVGPRSRSTAEVVAAAAVDAKATPSTQSSSS